MEFYSVRPPPTSRSTGSIFSSMEGYLKREINFVFSDKFYYKIDDNKLLYGKSPAEINRFHDLESFVVTKSRKNECRFFLMQAEGDNQIKLTAPTKELRDKWCQVLMAHSSTAYQQSLSLTADQLDSYVQQSKSQTMIDSTVSQSRMPAFSFQDKRQSTYTEFDQDMTLTDISNYLQDRNSELEQTMSKSREFLNTLKIDLNLVKSLLSEQKNVQYTVDTANQFQRCQEKAFGHLRQIIKQVFDIVELIAAKEIKKDPIEFVKQQNIPDLIQNSKNPKNLKVNTSDIDADQFNEYNSMQFDNGNDNMLRKYSKYSAADSFYSFHEDEDHDLKDGRPLSPQAKAKMTQERFIESMGVLQTGSFIRGSVDVNFMEEQEPLERDELPWLKDPSVKVSIWAIIKDSIGKDLSKMSVPVFFNDPTSLLQKVVQGLEYTELIDQAADEVDPIRRISLIAINQITNFTIAERSACKPFNPLLGETYEFVSDKIKFLAEQVSHHPPITANYCRGKKYTLFNNQKTNTKFTGKQLNFIQQYRTYVDLDTTGERFEILSPVCSAHNLVIGTTYVDIGETATITNLKTNDVCVIRFTRRGWFVKESFKLEGDVTCGTTGKVVQKIWGNWNSKIYMKPADAPSDSEGELMWTKNPYPERWQYMYGMSHFSLQVNYFPKRLQNVVPPTDTRRRPDQRALEYGDMKLATYEKDRLENKQRAVRKYKEENQLTHQQVYFDPWYNDRDGQTYYVYNHKYFENDRPKQNWSHLPDVFSEELSPEIEPYMPKLAHEKPEPMQRDS